MIVSFVTPAYNASATIGRTLTSVYGASLPDGWSLDVVVVDDGSADGDALRSVVKSFVGAQLYRLGRNQGKIAAVNHGVSHSQGDVVVILDADDTVVSQWPKRLESILEAWPQDTALCFSACQTDAGQTTVANPDYIGRLSFIDILNDRYMGEYLPIFRGEAIRASGGYRDPGKGIGCELWTYLTYAQKADLWITSEVLRVYHEQDSGSISTSLFTPKGAAHLVNCYDRVFADFEKAYETHAKQTLGRRRMRQAVFAAIAGERGRAWALWKRGARIGAPGETIGALILIALGTKLIGRLVALAKKFRIVRRYG